MLLGWHCGEERSLNCHPSKPSKFVNHAEAALNYELKSIMFIHCTVSMPILPVYFDDRCAVYDAVFWQSAL